MTSQPGGAAVTTPTALLRPALEAAVRVARERDEGDADQAVPAALRRFLRFARLPAPALDIARKVIEDDDAFRELVAEQLSESDVGEAGWLWLRRPDGWEERLDALRRARAEADHYEREQRAERDAHRRLGHAEDRARRAEALLARRDSELDAACRELGDARRETQQLAGALDQAEGQLRELHEQRGQAVRRLKQAEAELAQRNADLRQARHEARLREVELGELTRGVAGRPPDRPPAPLAPPEPAPATVELLDRARLAALVAQAAAAADALSTAAGRGVGRAHTGIRAGAGSGTAPRRRRAGAVARPGLVTGPTAAGDPR